MEEGTACAKTLAHWRKRKQACLAEDEKASERVAGEGGRESRIAGCQALLEASVDPFRPHKKPLWSVLASSSPCIDCAKETVSVTCPTSYSQDLKPVPLASAGPL